MEVLRRTPSPEMLSLWCPLSLGRCQMYTIWCGFRNATLRLVMQVHSRENCGWWDRPQAAAGAWRAWLTLHNPCQHFRGKRCCLSFSFLCLSPNCRRLVFCPPLFNSTQPLWEISTTHWLQPLPCWWQILTLSLALTSSSLSHKLL